MKFMKRNIILCLLTVFIVSILSCKTDVETHINDTVTIRYYSDKVELPNKEKKVSTNYSLQSTDIPDLSFEKYSFNGWYIDDEKVVEGRVITKDTILVANLSDRSASEQLPNNPGNNDDSNLNPLVVSNIVPIVTNQKIVLAWDNPTTDYYGIELSMYPAHSYLKNGIILKKGIDTYSITNLKNQELYEFTLKVIDKNFNYGKPVETRVFLGTNDKENNQPPRIDILNVYRNQFGQSFACWRWDTSEDVTDPFSGVELSLSPAEGVLSSPISFFRSNSDFIDETLLTGLVDGKEYTLTARSFNGQLIYSEPKSVTFTYKKDNLHYYERPGEIESFNVSSFAPNMKLCWTARDIPNIQCYEINYLPESEAKLNVDINKKVVMVPVGIEEIYIPNLEPLISYQFSIRCLGQNGEYSTPMTAIGSVGEQPIKVPQVKDITIVKNSENKTLLENEFDYGDTFTLSSETKGIRIYYSTDGSTPPENSTKYTNPIMFTQDEFVLKVIGMAYNMNNSNIFSKQLKMKKYSVDFGKYDYGTTPMSNHNLKKGDVLTKDDLKVIDFENSGVTFTKWTDQDGNEITEGYVINHDLVLTPHWIDNRPSPVTKLYCLPGDSKITLKWINPAETDIKHIKITSNVELPNFPLIIENPEPGAEVTKEIIGLVNGNKYLFTVTSIDNSNFESEQKLCEEIPNSPNKQATSIPGLYVLSQGTNGTYGPKGTYVEFGLWPQSSYKGDKENLTKCEDIKPWTNCYKDLAGNVYSYLDSNHYIYSGYYKLEPIKWRVLKEDKNGEKLLFCENIIDNEQFYHNNSYPNNRVVNNVNIVDSDYRYSRVRAYLNGTSYPTYDNHSNYEYNDKGLLQTAFTADQQKAISLHEFTDFYYTIEDHTLAENQVSYTLSDKLFLLSWSEIQDYCYSNGNHTNIREETDYGTNHLETASYYTRSPYYSRSVIKGNDISSYFAPGDRHGIVPALCINYTIVTK